MASFHIVAVIAAVVTVVLCLRATDTGFETDHGWRNAVWISLSVTGGILVLDVIADATRLRG